MQCNATQPNSWKGDKLFLFQWRICLINYSSQSHASSQSQIVTNLFKFIDFPPSHYNNIAVLLIARLQLLLLTGGRLMRKLCAQVFHFFFLFVLFISFSFSFRYFSSAFRIPNRITQHCICVWWWRRMNTWKRARKCTFNVHTYVYVHS